MKQVGRNKGGRGGASKTPSPFTVSTNGGGASSKPAEKKASVEKPQAEKASPHPDATLLSPHFASSADSPILDADGDEIPPLTPPAEYEVLHHDPNEAEDGSESGDDVTGDGAAAGGGDGSSSEDGSDKEEDRARSTALLVATLESLYTGKSFNLFSDDLPILTLRQKSKNAPSVASIDELKKNHPVKKYAPGSFPAHLAQSNVPLSRAVGYAQLEALSSFVDKNLGEDSFSNMTKLTAAGEAARKGVLIYAGIRGRKSNGSSSLKPNFGKSGNISSMFATSLDAPSAALAQRRLNVDPAVTSVFGQAREPPIEAGLFQELWEHGLQGVELLQSGDAQLTQEYALLVAQRFDKNVYLFDCCVDMLNCVGQNQPWADIACEELRSTVYAQKTDSCVPPTPAQIFTTMCLKIGGDIGAQALDFVILTLQLQNSGGDQGIPLMGALYSSKYDLRKSFYANAVVVRDLARVAERFTLKPAEPAVQGAPVLGPASHPGTSVVCAIQVLFSSLARVSGKLLSPEAKALKLLQVRYLHGEFREWEDVLKQGRDYAQTGLFNGIQPPVDGDSPIDPLALAVQRVKSSAKQPAAGKPAPPVRLSNPVVQPPPSHTKNAAADYTAALGFVRKVLINCGLETDFLERLVAVPGYGTVHRWKMVYSAKKSCDVTCYFDFSKVTLPAAELGTFKQFVYYLQNARQPSSKEFNAAIHSAKAVGEDTAPARAKPSKPATVLTLAACTEVADERAKSALAEYKAELQQQAPAAPAVVPQLYQQGYVIPLQGAACAQFSGGVGQIYSGGGHLPPSMSNSMMVPMGGMQGSDMYGAGMMVPSGSFQNGNVMVPSNGYQGGNMIVPSGVFQDGNAFSAGMHHPHSRDFSRPRQLQIGNGSEYSADGGGNGYGYYAGPRLPHQQSDSFPFGGGS